MISETWTEQANCKDVNNPEIFFDKHQTGHALKICLDCPVRAECFDYAYQTLYLPPQHHLFGVWGGTTYLERRRVWKNNGRKRRTWPFGQHLPN